MKKIVVRIITIFLLAVTFFIIFQFSNQNGEKSSGVSQKFVRIIIEKLPQTKELSEDTKIEIIQNSQVFIRKGAHFSIYMIVGMLIMTFMSTYKVKIVIKIFISILVGATYAISDEIHQSFIPGRASSIIDVGIDTLGVICGITIIIIIISIYKAIFGKTNAKLNRRGERKK